MAMCKRDLTVGVLVTVLWGCNYGVIELGLSTLDPSVMTLLRFTLCAVPLVFFIRRPTGVSTAAMALYGVLFAVGIWWMVNFAMYQGLSPGMASVFLQFSAFFTILLSAVFLRERITAAHFWGMAFAACGLGMMLLSSSQSSTVIGLFLVLLAALAWALCNLLIKLKRPGEMTAFIVWSSLFSLPFILAFIVASQGWKAFEGLAHGLAWEALFSVLFQSLITTILGYRVWNNLMKKYPATQVAPLSLLVPVSGLVTSCIFFGERLGAGQWLAIGLILTGMMVFFAGHLLRGIGRRVVRVL
ncbi:MAG: EamA family transporter [Pseudomonas sp.]